MSCECWNTQSLCEKCINKKKELIDVMISIFEGWKTEDKLAIVSLDNTSGMREAPSEDGPTNTIQLFDGNSVITISTHIL